MAIFFKFNGWSSATLLLHLVFVTAVAVAAVAVAAVAVAAVAVAG